MSSLILSLFSERVFSAFRKQGKLIASLAIVILTANANRSLRENFFHCPVGIHRFYGWCFLFGPALIIAMVVLLVSFSASQVLDGIFKKAADAPVNEQWDKKFRTWKFILRRMLFSFVQSIIGFCCWVILTLLTSEAYSCIKLGPKPISLKDKAAIHSFELKKERYDAFSKSLGFFFLVGGLVIATATHCVIKCCFTDPPKKMLPHMDRYDELEALAANKAFEDHMAEVAKANGKRVVYEALNIDNKDIDSDEKENDGRPTAARSITSLDDLENVRKFLSSKYPRLENKANTEAPYRDKHLTFKNWRANEGKGGLMEMLPLLDMEKTV